VTHRLGGFPKLGDVLVIGSFQLRVEELEGRRVARLKLERVTNRPIRFRRQALPLEGNLFQVRPLRPHSATTFREAEEESYWEAVTTSLVIKFVRPLILPDSTITT